MYKRIFKDDKLQQEIERNGFISVPFLTDAEKDELMSFYQENPYVTESSYHSTVLSDDISYRQKVHNKIKEVFSRALDNIFLPEYRFLFGSFTVKENGEDSQWAVHQDWTFVDERKFSSVGVWCPLIDVNYDNGCLGVVRGSHNFFYNVRGTNTISEYSSVANDIEKKYLTFVPVKAGHAVIFYNSLIHYSPPNVTKDLRVTGNCVMIHKEAQPVHIFRDRNWPEDEVEPFAIDTDFLIHNNYMAAARPERGTSLGRKKLKIEELTGNQMRYLAHKHSYSVIERVKALFEKTELPEYPNIF